jgi:transposase InsO family protein
MKHDKRREIALWRMSVLGPLVSARLHHGDRKMYFETAAAPDYEAPSGRRVRVQPRTIEAWYYAYLHGGLEALEPKPRRDRGTRKVIAPDVAKFLVDLRREERRRSARILIKTAVRAKLVRPGELSLSTVLRLLRAHGLSQRPAATPPIERRAFIVEHPGDLWMGDSMRGPLVLVDTVVCKSWMLSQLDCATRYAINSEFFTNEDAARQEDGLRHGITGHGVPRMYYVDRGPAYIADSLYTICAELGICLLHAKSGDCEAKGAIERWHKTWRAEVGIELPEAPLPVGELNERHMAWLRCEYHHRVHETTGKMPLEHFLAGHEYMRPVPPTLEEIFLHREDRKVRNDGTIRWGGGLYEVPGEYVGMTVELRHAPLQPHEAPWLYVDGERVCQATLLDRIANSTKRRRELPQPEPVPRVLKGPLDYITEEYREMVGEYFDEFEGGYDPEDMS